VAATKKNTSALREKQGVLKPETLNPEVVKHFKNLKKKTQSAQELVAEILNHNQTALSEAITITERTAPKHQQKAREIIAA